MKFTLNHLRKAGLTEAQILRVVEVADAEQSERRQEQNREAARKYRTRRQQNHADSADRQQNHADKQNHADAESACVSKKERKKKGSKHTLPENWVLTDKDRAYARMKGWPDTRIDTEGERFRLYYLTKASLITDDHLTWCKWVISPFQNGNGGRGNGQGRRHGSVLDACDRLREKLNAQGSFAEQYVPGSSGPTPLRLDQDVRPTGLRVIPKG
jgi:hypothetical protein